MIEIAHSDADVGTHVVLFGYELRQAAACATCSGHCNSVRGLMAGPKALEHRLNSYDAAGLNRCSTHAVFCSLSWCSNEDWLTAVTNAVFVSV